MGDKWCLQLRSRGVIWTRTGLADLSATGFMSKKFTTAQRSYRTFEHEVLTVIEALMKWEDKLVGRKFHIVTDHEALETIKTSNCDGKSGCLIHWDKYLSCFKYEIMHVPGIMNKVADCLSCYYENDRYNEIHESHHYVSGRCSVRSKLWGLLWISDISHISIFFLFIYWIKKFNAILI